MQMPYFVIIEQSRASSEEVQKFRGEHLKYVKEFHQKGKVFAAGRFLDNSGGMIIVNVGGMDEAEEIAKNDPYILNKVRDYAIKSWDRVF